MSRMVAAIAGLAVALTAIDGVRVARVVDARERGGAARLSGADDVVASYLAATSALWRSGGDPRVAERVPAVPDLVSESLAGMSFAERRLGVTERHDLVRMERLGSRWLPGGVVEVRTREYWVYRLRGRDRPEPEVRSMVLAVRYELVPDGSSWRIVDYRLDASPDGAAGEGG